MLVFDHRHFGASEGSPRQLLDIATQQEEWAAGVHYARSRAEVDSACIILWGTSLSGGHALAMAEKVGAAAVIAQIPHTDGLASTLAVGPVQAAKLAGHAIYDALRGVMGRSPHYLPASGTPGTTALMTAPEASRYLNLVPDGYDFDQRIAARFVLHIVLYSPGRNMRVLDVPVLVQVGSRDATIPRRPTVRAARRAPRSTLRIYASGHFEPYTGDMFEIVVADQLMFLDRHFRSDGHRTRTAAVTGTRVDIGPEEARTFPQRGLDAVRRRCRRHGARRPPGGARPH